MDVQRPRVAGLGCVTVLDKADGVKSERRLSVQGVRRQRSVGGGRLRRSNKSYSFNEQCGNASATRSWWAGIDDRVTTDYGCGTETGG